MSLKRSKRKLLVDAHVIPPLDESTIEGMVSVASKLGTSTLGVTFDGGSKKETIKNVERICNEHGVDLVTRIDITVPTRAHLLRELGKVRRRFELVGVACVNESVAHAAAKDRRVDIIDFPGNRSLTNGVAELASRGMTAFEINACEIIGLRGFPRIRLLSKLRREVKIAERHGVPIVLSSGARDRFMLRAPRDLAFLATSLLDVKEQAAFKMVLENPCEIIRRNREKLSPGFVMPGVKIVG